MIGFCVCQFCPSFAVQFCSCMVSFRCRTAVMHVHRWTICPISLRPYRKCEKEMVQSLNSNISDLSFLFSLFRLNKSVYTRHVSRVVVMIIDAFRIDFLQTDGSMRYTNDLINAGNACYLNVEVEPPTVTMPRIKAITTGSIPNFIDVVLNLGSSKLNIDSLLHQINDANGTIVFAGDNTWTKMFPDMFVRKYENEDSLYVNDFVEVRKFHFFFRFWFLPLKFPSFVCHVGWQKYHKNSGRWAETIRLATVGTSFSRFGSYRARWRTV